MTPRSLFAIFLLTTTLVAVPLSSATLSAPTQTTSKEISITRMGFTGVRLGSKAAQVQQRFGKPQKVRTEQTNCCGVLLHWTYPEFEVSFEVPEGTNQERNATVYSVSTQSAKLMTLEGVRVGDRRSKVLRVYGTSDTSENNKLYYYNNQYASSFIFRFENDRVVEILAATQLN
jgi:hypothetical protein